MLWPRESLLMNSTRVPGGTVNSRGLAMPPAEMVIDGWFDGGGGDGPEGGDPPPHAAAARQSTEATARSIYWIVIRPFTELLSGSLWSWNPQEPAPAKPKLSLVWFADSNPTLAIDGQFV